MRTTMKNLAVALFFAFCYLSTGCTDTLVDPSEVCVSFSLDKIQTPLGTVVRVTPTILDIQYELTVNGESEGSALGVRDLYLTPGSYFIVIRSGNCFSEPVSVTI